MKCSGIRIEQASHLESLQEQALGRGLDGFHQDAARFARQEMNEVI
jgi:hypothetical protein